MTDNRSWTLPRQHQLLTSHLGKFKEHQAAGTLMLKFWPKITRKFFTMWKSEKRELREWQILKDMVEGGMAVPTCLGGGTSKEAKEAGLNIVSARVEREGHDGKKDDGDNIEGDDDDNIEDNDNDNDNSKLSDLSSDEEDVRAANEAAMADPATVPTPDGGQNPAPKPKRKKKKKPIIINIPTAVRDHKKWMSSRNKQIQRWYYNATSKARQGAPKVNIDFKGLISSSVGGRALTEPQMYSRMYYETRVKHDVEAEMTQKNLSKGERIALTAKVLQEAYEGESEKVKQEVREEIAKASREKEEAMELLKNMVESGGEREQTPEEYAKIQGSLRPIIRCFFDMLGPLAGYTFFVMGGGPKSDNLNGAMGYVLYNRGWGESRNEFTFNRWYDDYHEHLIQPFGEFCHELFPEQYRLQRAITIADAPNLSLDALRKSGRNFGKLQSGGEIIIEKDRPVNAAAIYTEPLQFPKPKPKATASVKDAALPAPQEKAKRGKGRKKAVTSSEDEDADDEGGPDDPSDHDMPRIRRKGGKAVPQDPGKKGEKERSGGAKTTKGTTTKAGSKEGEVGEGKAVQKETKSKGGKSGKGSKKSKKTNKNGDDKSVDVTDKAAKGTKKTGHHIKATIVNDESSSEREAEDTNDGMDVEKAKETKQRNAVGSQNVEDDGANDNDSDDEDAEKVERKTKKRNAEARENPPVDEDNRASVEQTPVPEELEREHTPAPLVDTHFDDTIMPKSPRLPFLPAPPEANNKRKPDSTILDDGGRQKRSRRQVREVEEWVTASKAFLLGCSKSKVWEQLVNAWYEFETTGFDRPSRITDIHSRPHELKRWLQARKSSMPGAFPPIVDDLEDFKERWMAWWQDIKGAGRDGEGSEVSSRAIRKSGPSGVVTILFGLAFWSPKNTQSAEWKEVVREMAGHLKPEGH